MAVSTNDISVKPGEVKELRLAVVCYGGVSLAIYMHGMTKEIHRLVKASTLLEAGSDGDGILPSERVYADLLRRKAEEHPDGVRTRVVVDAISGTSAGGINGVYLAKALAHNLSQDELRDLWIDKGDIGKLLAAPGRLRLWMKAVWVLSRAIKKPALRGNEMAVWLYEALESMDRRGPQPHELRSLMPPDHLLQLFVTTTDFYGYGRQVLLADADPKGKPAAIHDWRHRHMLEFRYGNGRDDFGSPDNAGLAFAARATSCFPGAFEPVSFEIFQRYLADKEVDLTEPDLEKKYFRLYRLSKAAARETFFIDGGVLDNRPFGYAIQAIRQRSATGEVDRRLLYLEPDPGSPGKPPARPEPSPIPTVLGSISGIPRKEPLLDDLLDVAALNERVLRIRDIIEVSFDKIAARVETEVAESLDNLPEDPAGETMTRWQKAVNNAAVRDAGFGYATYVRMKISGVIDRYAQTVCAISEFPDDANQAFFVRLVLRTWAEKKLLFEKVTPPSQEQVDFLKSFDLEYAQRRLRFVLAGVSWYYRDRADDKSGYPSVAELDRVKARLWQGIEELQATMRGEGRGGEVDERLRACFAEEPIDEFVDDEGFLPAVYAERQKDDLDRLASSVADFLGQRLEGFTASLYRDLYALTREWDDKHRKDLFVRYLGFPFWDVLLYPIQALGDVGERDHVQITRMSPLDAKCLEDAKRKWKLEGKEVFHFGAFFARDGRERDYLWGRLDGAERLVEVLLGREHSDFEEWCRRAFEAILAEEKDALPLAAPFIDDLRGEVAKLGGHARDREALPA
jgi:patatin-related protein